MTTARGIVDEYFETLSVEEAVRITARALLDYNTGCMLFTHDEFVETLRHWEPFDILFSLRDLYGDTFTDHDDYYAEDPSADEGVRGVRAENAKEFCLNLLDEYELMYDVATSIPRKRDSAAKTRKKTTSKTKKPAKTVSKAKKPAKTVSKAKKPVRRASVMRGRRGA